MLSTWLNSLVAHAVVVGVRDDGQSEVHAKIKAWKETRMKNFVLSWDSPNII